VQIGDARARDCLRIFEKLRPTESIRYRIETREMSRRFLSPGRPFSKTELPLKVIHDENGVFDILLCYYLVAT
jgi:hypothetical protein